MKTIRRARSLEWGASLLAVTACNGDVLLGNGDANEGGIAFEAGPAAADGAGTLGSPGMAGAATGDAGSQATVVAVSVGADSACALTANGGVLCWGANQYGQLGNNSTVDSFAIPVPVTGLGSGVSAISVGSSSACALTANGGVQCWGDNQDGQLGNNNSTVASSAIAAPVTGLTSGVTAVSVGYGPPAALGSGSTCALTRGGGVQCWGDNLNAIGSDSTVPVSAVPVPVTGLEGGVIGVSVGYGHACALTVGGEVQCWGFNLSGQLGTSTAPFSAVPMPVTGLPVGTVAVSAGDNSTCALTAGGQVTCWGLIAQGPFIGGPSGPVSVAGLSSGVTAVSVGSLGAGACALTAGGGVECWGYTLCCDYAYPPVPVPGLESGVAAVSVGGTSACALTVGGGVECWGENEVPVPVTGLGGTHNP